jgi:NADPH-dependent glutamate synthase beta subunit-like oxidoreductase/glutamate synthase domain-containing protein 3/NAD-dependent dihydropyrimidine dehydrogenase PreA subunit
MNIKQVYEISGEQDGQRVESRILEEQIQEAVAAGNRHLLIKALGQHGIGGRLWKTGNEPVHVNIYGQCGQRVGAMGYPNTNIEIMGPASDDVGWLNAGAQIVVHGNAGNGVANAMAQGKVYVAGNIGARGMTMTKHNPRMEPPELWVLGSAGDYFGEFMAGGIAVICGHKSQNPDNILGYRPFVGMVGGKVFFRGPHTGYSQTDARTIPISDDQWQWLSDNLRRFTERISRHELLDTLLDRNTWQLIVARTPQERIATEKRSMQSFRTDVWENELGQGGLIGDLTQQDRSPIPVIVTGELRRFVPVWENKKYLAPCEGSCPTGIPVQQRWQLIREGRVDEAVDLALAYTPFPATVCGYLCPNLCMSSCTRQIMSMAPVDVTEIGKASISAKMPEIPEKSGKKIAVIGGGPAGISIAWQLHQKGHEAVIYDMAEKLGGKITSVIPESRIPKEVIEAELDRAAKVIPRVNLTQELGKEDVDRMKGDFDFIVIASGAQNPRTLPVPGKERMIPALEFLFKAKTDATRPGKTVVIIGAGNVGCDAATEAHRLGAEDITLIDIMEPASFGKEREEAEKAGAKFKWPCFTKEISEQGVVLTTGETVPADTVIISIGDAPDLDFLPDDVACEHGFIVTNDLFQTSTAKIFAVGDAVKPGLLTDAIGAGRKAATAICDIIDGRRPAGDSRRIIDKNRISLEYFDPRIVSFDGVDQCGAQCSSCGSCRDCGICESVCPQAAISRVDLGNDAYEYAVDSKLCIGCGFCAGVCPCGIWGLMENDPIE